MSRRILIAVACLLSTLLSVNAQVENYCLRLAQGGNVDCGAMPELDGKTSYSVQFFINPTTWTEGATVYARGDDFKAALSTSGAILFTVGSTNLKATGDVKAGSWSQVTLTVADGSAKVLINDQVVASGTLGAIPASTESFIIGGGSYAGRIDELRLWQGTLNGDFDYFYNNTLNRWNPQWDMLVAYYKFDQSSCDAVVDYKSIYTRAATNHHGAFSVSGATREKVTDNVRLPYLINAAYTNNSRFYDRSIPREQYLLSNEIIILGINSFSDGHLAFITPNNHGTVTNGTYLSDYKGRKGVLSLAGAGSDMACTTNCLTPAINSSGVASTGYTFETWIYLEKWTEGAYIFRKETADGQHGFSIRLGADSTKQVIVRCNGKNFVNVNSMKVGEWLYFGVSPFQGDTPRQTFLFSYNGVGKFAVSSLSDNSIDYTPTGMDTCVAHIGENLNAKLDNTCIWDQKFGADGISGHYSYGIPMPALGKTVAADIMNNSNSYYTYDNPDNVGYSSHSQDEWRRIMQSAYEGYSGYHTVISVQSHSGWLTTIANAAKRKIFAADLARLSDGYDGVELDLEWADTQSAWNTYGLLADEIKAVLPARKTFRISCHAYGAYLFPTAKMGEVDGFHLPAIRPQQHLFHLEQFHFIVCQLREVGIRQEENHVVLFDHDLRSIRCQRQQNRHRHYRRAQRTPRCRQLPVER
jgi:hypothetical protein